MSTQPEDERPTPGPTFGKGTVAALFAWGLIVLAFSAGGLADVTGLWWLVLVFGTAAPVALLAARGWASRRNADAGAVRDEQELLAALREYGELTPTAAAMLTGLTASEAAKALEGLTRGGHLEARAREGAISYAMREGDLRAVSDARQVTAADLPRAMEDDPSPARRTEPPADPLSDRELAVLGLLARGRTNKEIAKELFVAEGTVKAHVAGVYRKLGVHSRAEAVSRAAGLDLIQQ
jgi:ATP/maltotriose-dependent transcriptional regulator MalT